MKTTQQIEKELANIAGKIKANETKINDLCFIDDRREAAAAHDFAKVKQAREAAKDNTEEINALSQENEVLRIMQKIMLENMREAIKAEYLPKIAEIMKPYEGKKCGEKTREKIREAAHNAGFSFYFDYYSLPATTLVFYPLENGYRYGSEKDVKLYSTMTAPFIDRDNVIRYQAAQIQTGGNRYTENPRQKAKQIIKQFIKLRKAYEDAKKVQDEYNNMIPANMKSQNKVDTYLYMF